MTDSSATAAARPIPASVLLATPRPEWLAPWCAFAAEAQPLPDAVIARAKLVLLDSIGVIAAGMQEDAVRALAELRATGGCAAVIGAGRAASPGEAAFLNGVAGTTLELDEGNQFARGHPGIHVVPAVLAAGAARPGAELLRALVLGYEIGARIGIASRLRVTMHPHGTWGTVGAALGVARLAGADAAGLANTVNIAAGLSLATSRRTMLEGADVRNAFAGLSNQLGLLAWDLHRSGFVGERDAVATVFDGIVADDFAPSAMLDALGTRWEIARNYFKMHAACRYTHATLDVVEALMADPAARVSVDEIAEVVVETYSWAAQLDRPGPETMLAAKFSIPFAVATTLVRGQADIAGFRDAARADPAIAALAARVSVREDAAMTAALPGERPARVTIRFHDGRSVSGETRTNRGDTENPYPAAAIVDKFERLAATVWDAATVAALRDAVLTLDTAASCAPLLALLATPPRG